MVQVQEYDYTILFLSAFEFSFPYWLTMYSARWILIGEEERTYVSSATHTAVMTSGPIWKPSLESSRRIRQGLI